MIVPDRVVRWLCSVRAKRGSATATRYRRLDAIVATIVGILTMVSQTSAQSAPWHYDLRSGDHLTYRYTFHRQIDDKKEDEHSQTAARFHSQVLVVKANSEGITVGFQRNREAAELTQYTSKGRDRLAHELPDFQKRMQARPRNFSEAMEISTIGDPRASWEIARETTSHIVGTLHEIMPLPSSPVTKGETWHTNSMPGLDLRWLDDEVIHGKPCRHIEAASPDGSTKINYWWSPDSGVIEQIALDGTYSNYGSTIHETAHMELESRMRGETIEQWLKSSDARNGALQAILLSSQVPVSAEQLVAPLGSGDNATVALALAIADRRKINLPPDVLQNLQQSSSLLILAELRQLS